MLKCVRLIRLAFGAITMLANFGVLPANATPKLVFDVRTGAILYQEQANHPWFPASLSKLMTAYVALNAVKQGKMSFDAPFVVTRRAAVMPPAKMGFQPGTIITLGNALKILMVKSANDVAITVAEGVDGSVEAFADDMNRQAAAIGMRESHFVNPNGLPDARQVSSARDMAVLAQAIYRDFPEQAALFEIGELQLGNRMIHTYNGLLGRYDGADGMKTGFTCAAGFNIVAGATRNGRHLIAVVMGQNSARARAVEAADLLEQAFSGQDKPSGSIQSLAMGEDAPPDMHDIACGHHRRAGSETGAESEEISAPQALEPRAPVTGPAGQPPERSDANAAAALAYAPQAVPPANQSIGEATVALPKPQFIPVVVSLGRAPGSTAALTPAVADQMEITPFPLGKAHHRRLARRPHAPSATSVVAKKTSVLKTSVQKISVQKISAKQPGASHKKTLSKKAGKAS